MIKKFYEYHIDNIKLFFNSIEKFKITVDEYDYATRGEYNNIQWLEFNKKELSSLSKYFNIERSSYIDHNYTYGIFNLEFNVSITKLYDDYYYILLYDLEYTYYYKLDQLTELKYFINCLKKYLKDD